MNKWITLILILIACAISKYHYEKGHAGECLFWGITIGVNFVVMILKFKDESN